MEFSDRSMRLLIKGQTELRVSKSASTELGEFLEGFADDVAEEAVETAREQGYQTVKQRHIKNVLEERTSLSTSSNLTFRYSE